MHEHIGFQTFGSSRSTWKACYNTDCWTPLTEFLIQSVGVGTETSFLTSSQMRLLLLLLVRGPHFEKHCTKNHIVEVGVIRASVYLSKGAGQPAQVPASDLNACRWPTCESDLPFYFCTAWRNTLKKLCILFSGKLDPRCPKRFHFQLLWTECVPLSPREFVC